jgi:glycosyltransferase involved in cell wall biosynthesis
MNRFALRRWSPEVLYAHSPELAALGRLVLRSCPCALHLHGVANPLEFSRFAWARNRAGRALYDLVYRIALRSSHRILVSSSVADRDALCARFALPVSRTTLVPTVVDADVFVPLPKDRVPVALHFVAVCRLSRVKRVHLAIEAFAALKETYRQAILTIAGDGEERRALESLAIEKVPDGSVRFLGEVERRDVATILRDARALLMPSAAEGFPIAAIESLACGTPVVCAPAGALSEIVRDGMNGFFVNPDSRLSFAAGMAQAIEMFPKLRQNCVDSAQAYTIGRVGPLVEETLLSLRTDLGTNGKASPRAEGLQ